MLDKKLKRNLIACCISLILINIMTGIMNLSFDKFQFGSVFYASLFMYYRDFKRELINAFISS